MRPKTHPSHALTDLGLAARAWLARAFAGDGVTWAPHAVTLAGRSKLAAAVLAIAAAFGGLSPGRAYAVGVLVPTDQAVEPLMVKHHRVTVTVRERSAETRVDQVFRNHTARRLEATYVFPVPPGAAVSGFAMWIDGQRIEGELLDAGQARGIYEQIVARMRDPGLVEHLGGSLFRARVFPIEPNSDQRIEISFTHTLDYDAGVVHYRYPLRTGGRAARTLEDLTIRVDIVSRTPIRAVYSPTHAIGVSRPDDHRATVGFEANAVALDQDFDLYYAVQDREVGLSLLTHRAAGEDGYFLAMIAPRTEVTEREIAAKEMIFVFDTSGSMAGEKIERARAALDSMLIRLRPADRFQVVRFSTDVEALFDGGQSVPATPENVARARRFARSFAAAGGTAIQPALVEALRAPMTTGMPRMVIFMTDGMPTVGETDTGRIVEQISELSGDARLFVFGVGDDVNTTFLDALAQRNRGLSDYYRDGAEMERRIGAFYDRIAYPLLTDLALAIPGMGAFDVYPRDLGHLYKGQQLLVVGRYRGEGEARVTLRGKVSGETEARVFAFDVRFPAVEPLNDFLPRLWSTRKVGYLLDEIRLHGDRPELRDEIIRLARRFGIVTPYTSYLVAPDGELSGITVPRPTFATDSVEGHGVAGRGPGTPLRSPTVRPTTPVPTSGERAAARDFESFSRATAWPAPESPAARAGGGFAQSSSSNRSGALAPQAPSLAPEGGMGESGRRLSARLRDMREAERTDASGDVAARFVAGRTFTRQDGSWTDERFRPSMRVLRVRAMSPAYFALLRARPELARPLALGDRVTVALDGTRAVVVDPAAPDVSDADVQAFLR
jgi:Ca-activated chloride channel family protein